MKLRTNYTRILTPFKIFTFCVGLLFIANSCNVFEDEFKQDKQLAKYRYQMYIIPDSITSNFGRVDAYISIIKEASADELLITPRKKNKLLSEVYNTLSGYYFELGDAEKAISNSTLSIVLNGTNQDAFYNRACIYQAIGNDSLAIIDYSKAILFDERYTDSYYNRGIIYERRTDYQLAIEDYSQAIKLSPSYIVDVYNNRGNVYQEMKFYTKARDEYDKALALDSMHAITYCNRADTYMKLNEPEKALEDYKKAYKTDSLNIAILEKINHLRKDKKNKMAFAE